MNEDYKVTALRVADDIIIVKTVFPNGWEQQHQCRDASYAIGYARGIVDGINAVKNMISIGPSFNGRIDDYTPPPAAAPNPDFRYERDTPRGPIRVLLKGRHVGHIRGEMSGHLMQYRYWPKGSNTPGEAFFSIDDVKHSIEAE